MQTKIAIKEEFIKQAELLARGAEVLPGGVMELAMKLQKSKEENKPLRIKLGMDPSRPDLHLGHTVVMRKIKQFQDLGHKIILIVGGGTGMIGDPSGKSDTRPSLTKEQVEKNAQTYFEQISKVVDVEKAEIRNNADWLFDLNFVDMLKLASKVTVAQIMTRDDFAKRYAENRPISVHEFFYPLMQAYDSVVVDADIELGGTDQRFNNLLGREIQSAYGKENPQMVMLLPLLEGTDGIVKMSKSFPEHCISLTDSPKDMYGKLMSISDNLIVKYFALLTEISNEELKEIEEKLKSVNPRDIKMKLAYTITEMYNGTEAAVEAQENFVKVVQNKEIPDDIPEVKIDSDITLIDFISNFEKSLSRGEIKRLASSGALKINSEKQTNPNFIISKSMLPVTVQYGKRKYIKGV
ncbi:TPA: tyrosine--tRNA ligase [Candidatus Avigastranaerophilus faecigallinarum]|nr:tyrosine--tRNA ligase [Candidatus Avigastranaerophilus faecigallinarum]